MAKAGKASGNLKKVINQTHKKGTSIGNGKIKLSSMNKHKRSSHKKYRGQGR